MTEILNFNSTISSKFSMITSVASKLITDLIINPYKFSRFDKPALLNYIVQFEEGRVVAVKYLALKYDIEEQSINFLKEKVSTAFITEDIFNDIMYHWHFWRQHVRKGGYGLGKLKTDKISDTFYPIDHSGFQFLIQKYFLHALLFRNVDTVYENEKQYFNDIDRIVKGVYNGEKFVVVTNHVTFFNIPIIISEFLKRGIYWGRPEILDKIYTILGPALLTQYQKIGILSISNVLKTLPNTPNAEIPGVNPRVMKKIRLGFLSTLVKGSYKSSENYGNSEGEIIVIAPTGTRDKLVWQEGELREVKFSSDSSDPNQTGGSIGLVKKLSADGYNIVMIGVNESSINKNLKNNPGDNKIRNKGKVPISLKIIGKEAVDSMIEEGVFMEALAGLVKNEKGESIGKTL